MKTFLSLLVVALLASPAFAQPDLPLEIPGMAVFIPWDEPGERVYGTAVMTVEDYPRCPLCSPLSWSIDLNWISAARPNLSEYQRHVPIWYSGAGAILFQFPDGIIALVPVYKTHADLIASDRWFFVGRLMQWYLTIKTIEGTGQQIAAHVIP